MTRNGTSNAVSASRRSLAALSYFSVVAAMIALSIWLAVAFFDRSNAVTIARERLAQIDVRAKSSQTANGADDPGATGSPFIEGQTITVAGAALQQRVDSAVVKAGGAVLSSQIVIDGPEAKDGFVSLTASVEIAQPGLQPLLYDLEAGMPYLFVDTLAIQSPQVFGEAESARMRVIVGVSGQWQPER
jgi:general secretion pathway protein M